MLFFAREVKTARKTLNTLSNPAVLDGLGYLPARNVAPAFLNSCNTLFAPWNVHSTVRNGSVLKRLLARSETGLCSNDCRRTQLVEHVTYYCTKIFSDACCLGSSRPHVRANYPASTAQYIAHREKTGRSSWTAFHSSQLVCPTTVENTTFPKEFCPEMFPLLRGYLNPKTQATVGGSLLGR